MLVRLAAVGCLLLVLLLVAPAEAGDYEKAAPWNGVRFVGEGVEVRVDDAWHELISIDGLATKEILAFVKEEYGSKWQKRFGEDLVEVLSRMGKAPGGSVALVLRKGGAEVRLPKVAMTKDNRRAVKHMLRGESDPPQRMKDEEEYPKLAPWDGVRWAEDAPEVRVGGTWFGLVQIDRVTVVMFRNRGKQLYGNGWQRRFEEDLVEFMAKLGSKPGPTVELILEVLDTGENLLKRGIRLTKANRDAVWRAAVAREAKSAARPTRRVVREHRSEPDPRYVSMTKRTPLPALAGSPLVSGEQAAADLDQLEWHLANEYSYADMRGVDYRAALDTIRLRLGDEITRGHLALQIHRLLCLMGDGHTRVRGMSREVLGTVDPDVELFWHDGVLVMAEPLTEPPQPPVVVLRIDNVPLERWIEAISDIIPAGSEAYRQWRIARDLRRYIPYVRAKLNLPHEERFEIRFKRLGDIGHGKVDMPLERLHPGSSSGGAVQWGRKGEVALLHIAEMSSDDEDLARIDIAMQDFKGLKGMVVDVRGNGGGSRKILRALAPYFMKPGELRVANVAAYRLPPGTKAGAPDGYMANRFLYPATASVWNDKERAFVKAHLAGFAADMVLPEKQFSAWHVMLLKRELNPKAYHFDKRIVVLMDGGCFSATDIFLGALKGMRNVTLMGTPSGGGSGRTQRITLANSGIRLRMSSMASFQPSGQRYDGVGIEPDAVRRPVWDDLSQLDHDSVLDRALKAVVKPLR